MTPTNFISRFAFAIALWSLAHLYIGFRLMKPARGRGRILGLALVLLMLVLPPLTLWLDRTGGVFALKDALRWTGFASIGFSALVAFTFFAQDLVRLAAWIARRLRGGRADTVDPER